MQNPGGMPPGGFNIPPPPFPPQGGNGAPVFTNGPSSSSVSGGFQQHGGHFNPSFAGDFNAQVHAEKQLAAMRRVRNIRAGLAIITFICLSKITVDARHLYAEEKGLLDTLLQADKDCNNNAPISSIEHKINPSASATAAASQQSSASTAAASATAGQQLNAIQQTNYTAMYCYAAQHFPMATVRHVVIDALGEYEGKLGQAIESSRARKMSLRTQQQNNISGGKNTNNNNNNSKVNGNGGNDEVKGGSGGPSSIKPATNAELMEEFNSLPRYVPARLFGGSVEHALRRANLTAESVERGIPCMTNEEANVRGIEHVVLRSMLRLGQAASFEGFGKSIWERKMEELQHILKNEEGK